MTSETDNHTAGRPRVLFVDDEPLILRSIKRSLSSEDRWDLRFAESGAQALDRIEEEAIEVIVSDMYMPHMDGATLLATVQARFPDTVRIVLSGNADRKLVYRAVPVAHQFLQKPFDPRLLSATLDRALSLRRLLANESLRRIVGGTGKLPSAPAVYTQLAQELSRADCSAANVAALIERDVALSARLAQLASSAYFDVPSGVTTTLGYVTYLGLDVVKILVLSLEIGDTFQHEARLPGFSVEELQQHSILTAFLARAIARKDDKDDAFLAGMLHDIGQLVLSCRNTEPFRKCLERRDREGTGLSVVEEEVLGADHGAVGAFLLGLWGLPQAVVEAVALHHKPKDLPPTVGLGTAVYLANLLARDPDVPVADDPVDPTAAIDAAVIEDAGGSVALDRWRALARRTR